MGKIKMEQFLKYKKIKDIKDLITEHQYNEINKLFYYYDTITIKNRLTNIRDFILNGVDSNWLGRLRIITNKLKNDVISEYSCKIRYGNNWEQKQNVLKEKVKMDKNNFIKKYGEDEGKKRWEDRNKKVVSYGLEPAIKRYGEEEGKKRWEKTLKTKIQTMSERKKIRPYRNGRTLTEYQIKYGVEEGYKKWEDRNKRQKYNLSLQGFIDKYGEVDGKMKWDDFVKNMSKTGLDSFIKRYGKQNGKKRYDVYINIMKYVTSKEYFIEKFGEIDGEIRYKELMLKKISYFKDKYSKISQDLFWNIFEQLEDKNCYFYELNNEYTFFVHKDNIIIIRVDFKMGNKIIEFDGDYWHSKPEQIKKDTLRDEYLTNKGYLIKRVKEKSYMLNKQMVINECLEFLKND